MAARHASDGTQADERVGGFSFRMLVEIKIQWELTMLESVSRRRDAQCGHKTVLRAYYFVMCLLMADVVMAADPPENDAAVLFHESFDDPQLPRRGWYDGSKFFITIEQPQHGKGCIEYRWHANTSTPASSSGVRHQFDPTDTVYLRCYIRLSKDWGWTNRPYHPHLMHFMTTENDQYAGPAASHLTVYIEPWNGRLRLATQDIQNKDQPHGLTQGPLKGGYNGRFFDSEHEVFTDDRWHCIEAMFQLNSLDVKKNTPIPDGIVRGWFDGKLVIDQQAVILRSTDFPKMQFNQFLLTPYFGPGLLPHAQTLWLDELSVATQRLTPAQTE